MHIFRGRSSPRHIRTRAHAGLTLIELMVALVVLGAIIAIGLPNFRGVLNSSRLTSSANEFLGAFHTARTEAIRRGSRVVICRSENGTSCAAGSTWPGWIVFVDSNADGAVSAGDELLKSGTFDESLVVRVSPAISGAGDLIRLGANGQVVAANELTLFSGRVAVCVASTQPTSNVRDIFIAFGARAVIQARNSGGNCSTSPANT